MAEIINIKRIISSYSIESGEFNLNIETSYEGSIHDIADYDTNLSINLDRNFLHDITHCSDNQFDSFIDIMTTLRHATIE